MSVLRRVKIFVPPLIQCCHRSGLNIQRPQASHLDRRIFEAVTIPVLPERLHDPYANCPRLKRIEQEEKENVSVETEEENAYEEYLLSLCRRTVNNNNRILVFQPFSMSASQKLQIKHKLMPHGLRLVFMGNQVFRNVLEGSKWQNLLPLVVGYNVYVVGNDVNVAKILKLTQPMPEMVLLGGLVGDNIFSREQLQEYAQLPNIDALRGQLVATMNSAAGKTRSLLGQHQQTLARNLDQYVKDGSPDS